MSIIAVGSGSYTTLVPPGQVGVVNFQGQPVSPLLASTFTGPVPTNDWASSLIFPFFGNNYSATLFAHPVAMKADAYGLNLSYTDTPTFYTYNGVVVKYEYTFHVDPVTQVAGDLSVGLQGMNAANTVLEHASDWMVTALWKDSDSANQLHATFGHGSPYTFYERDGNADVVIKVNSINPNTIGQPNATSEVFQIHHVNGVYNGGALNMDLLVNAIDGKGSHIGNAVQARISIDSNGDGKFDYTQTMNFIPLDGDANNSEHYLQNEARGVGAATSGVLQNLNNATIQVEVWKPFGSGDVQLQTGASSNVVLPFNNLTNGQGALSNQLFLDNTGSQNILTAVPAPAETIVLGAAPSTAASIPWDGAGTVFYHDHNVLGIHINGNNYGLFAPVGSDWILENGEVRSNLAGKDYFSSALLPDQSVDTLQYFYEHAFAFVTDSKATYTYHQSDAEVVTHFDVQTVLKEPGFSDQTLTTLYPHQWLNTTDPLTEYSYQSARGEMKLYEGNSFHTNVAYTGILPALPNMLDAAQTQQLYTMVDAEYHKLAASPIPVPFQDSYTAGKEIGRLSELTELASQVGHHDAKVLFLNTIKGELQNWFTADGTTNDKQFVYNAQWDTFQAYPASFESQKELNDHHFHYGYFIKGAATIAQFDPAWASEWGGMVNLLIQDVANTDRDSSLFPYLRNFDPYAGHSWANGHGAFFSGNNQESTSEAMNFASALTMWGAQTHNVDQQNLGAYLYATELSAIQQYWFDVNDMNFPAGFNHHEASILWGDGATYSTFFSADPEMIHGIQFLPMNGGSLYLGLNPNYAQINYNDMIQNNGGAPNQWVNIMLQYQAMFDSQAAVNALNLGYSSNREPTFESGDSLAHNYSWIHNFNALGQVEASVTADNPFFAVFNKNGLLTYTAYNPGDTTIVVHFSDGTQLSVASEELVAMNVNQMWSSVSGLVEHVPAPTPTPTPVPNPTPTPTPTPIPDPTPVPTPTPVPPPSGAINGTAADDFLSATGANDIAYGLAGSDQIHGLAGDDQLHGGEGDDHLYGNAGNDVLIGGAGKDFLVGGEGNDIFKYNNVNDSRAATPDFIESFQQGHDKIDLSALNVSFNQLVFTSSNGYHFAGIAGADFSIKVGSPVNFAASDFIFSGVVNPDPVPTPTPTPEPTPVPTPTPVVPPVDAIAGTAANDFLTAAAGNDVVFGLAGDDQLHGLSGNDELHGGGGNDHLYGNVGDDVLIGDAGADFVVGGEGRDVFKYLALTDSTTAGRDFIETFEKGSDKIDLSALNVNFNQLAFSSANGYGYVGIVGTDFSIKIGNGVTLVADDFILSGSSVPAPTPTPDPTPVPPPVVVVPPADAITGTAAGEFLSATMGNDTVFGLGGNDQIHGLDGNDALHGGDGNDHLYGNAGNDRLIGGNGADFLVGGEGADVYSYENLSDSTVSQRDTIEGFVHGRDQLDLTLLHISANDVHIQMHNGIQTVSVANTNFAVDLIASDPISHSDVAL
jgi:endoglucanase Acf2